jgi:hypothetical protein
MRAAHPHRRSLEAAERVLDAEFAFLNSNVPKPKALWQEVVMLLAGRALQLQRAAIDFMTIGYDEEVEPVARAMASAVVTLTAIGHGTRLRDRDAKAVRYLDFARRARKRQRRYLARSRWTTRERRLVDQAADDAEADELLARAAKEGVAPLVTGPQEKRFWSGYDDRTLFKRMGVLRWYEHFYAPWSEASHGQPRGLVKTSEQYAKTAAFDIGPSQRSPWFVLLAVSEFGFQLLVQLNRFFGMKRRADLVAFHHEWQAWFSDATRAEAGTEDTPPNGQART